MIVYYIRTVREERITEIPEFRKGCWIHVVDPTDGELVYLEDTFGLEKDLLADALDPYEVPRVELDEGITYVYTRVPDSNEKEHSTSPVLMAVGETFVLSVMRHSLPFLTNIIEGKTTAHTTQKTNFFIQFFFEITKSYNSSITSINRRIRSIQIDVRKVNKSEIAQFVIYENRLNDYLAALIPTDNLLRSLLSGRYLQLFEDDHDFVEDLKLANGQLLEIVNSNLKIIANVRSSYSALITTELNHTIRILTALTIILAVPTLIASLFGMNVPIPQSENPLAFVGIVGLSVFISLVLFIVFLKNRWL